MKSSQFFQRFFKTPAFSNLLNILFSATVDRPALALSSFGGLAGACLVVKVGQARGARPLCSGHYASRDSAFAAKPPLPPHSAVPYKPAHALFSPESEPSFHNLSTQISRSRRIPHPTRLRLELPATGTARPRIFHFRQRFSPVCALDTRDQPLQAISISCCPETKSQNQLKARLKIDQVGLSSKWHRYLRHNTP